MRLNAAGAAIIAGAEGDRLVMYLCPAKRWTVGRGHVLTNGRGRQLIGEADRAAAQAVYDHRWPNGMTEADEEALFAEDVAPREQQLGALLAVPVNDNQWSALVSFLFNEGSGNLASSHLLQFVNERDFERASREFPRWNMSQGVVLNGLITRRAAERALFDLPC